MDGESVAVAVDDAAELPAAATVDAVAGAAPSLATESPNLLSLNPWNRHPSSKARQYDS